MMSQNLRSSGRFGEVTARKMATCHLCRTKRMCNYVSVDWREAEGDWTAYNCWLCGECEVGLRADGVVVVDWHQLMLDSLEQLAAEKLRRE